MKDQHTPPMLIAGIRAGDRSQDVNRAYFKHHLTSIQYERAYIADETSEAIPLGTTIIVRRIGVQHLRTFVPPQGGLN